MCPPLPISRGGMIFAICYSSISHFGFFLEPMLWIFNSLKSRAIVSRDTLSSDASDS